MKLFLTGGSGFIGRHLREGLEGRHEVVAPLSSELDLLDEDAVARHVEHGKYDVVVHAATWNATRNSPKDVSKVVSNNLRMFFNVARLRERYGKMIYFGSGAEYDLRKCVPKIGEGRFDLSVPADDYGFSKYVMAKYAGCADNIYDLRLFGVFGKYEDWEIRFISNACCKVVWDLPVSIRQNVFFDYMDVKDLVGITEWFITNTPKRKHYNVCTGRTLDLRSIAEKVFASSGKNLDIVVAKKGLGKEYGGDNSRLLEEMNGYRLSDMNDSIRDLYHWYEANRNMVSRVLLLSDK
jgi:UDP-glucose 4-epimerase